MPYADPSRPDLVGIFMSAYQAQAQQRAHEQELAQQKAQLEQQKQLHDIQMQQAQTGLERSKLDLQRQELTPEAVSAYQGGHPEMLQMLDPGQAASFDAQGVQKAAAQQAKDKAAADTEAKRVANVQRFAAQTLQANPQSLPKIVELLARNNAMGSGNVSTSMDPAQLSQQLMASSSELLGAPAAAKPEGAPGDAASTYVFNKYNLRPGAPGYPEKYDAAFAMLQAQKQRAGMAGMGGMQPSSELTGEEFLKTLPPGRQAIIKSVIEGRSELPKGAALKSPLGQQIINDVASYDPSFDASQWKVRNTTRTDFTTGAAAKNIRNLNTMVHHLGNAVESAQALANGDYPLWNAVANKSIENRGDPRITRFRADVAAATGEAASLFKGTGATDQELEAMRRVVPENGSLAQQLAGLKRLMTLGFGRMGALQDQWNNAFKGAQQFEFLSPESRRVLHDKLGMDAGGAESGTAPQSNATSAPSASAPPAQPGSGMVRVRAPDGRTGQMPANEPLPPGWSKL